MNDDEVVVRAATVPTAKEVRNLLADLLARDVNVASADPFSGDDGATTYAVYVDDLVRARVVAVGDAAFSAYAGAAIGLVPAELARSAASRRRLPAMLAENLDEVLNVCAAALNGEDREHLRLYAVHHIGTDTPHDLVSFAAVPGRRLDLEVRIPGYGDGLLSFVGID